MAEKTDEEIIKEVGLETTDDISNEDALAALSFDNDTNNNNDVQIIEQDNEPEELTPILNNNVEQIDNIDVKEEQEQNNVIENEDKDDETNKVNMEQEEEIPVQKKQPKIYRILMIIVAALASILVIGLIMYLTGFFDPEEPKPMPKPMPEVEMKMDEGIEFNEKEINKEKLNRKLTALTKTEIMNKEELEAEEKRIQEEERKKKEAEQKAIEEKQRLEEEKKQAQLAKIEEERRLLEEHRMAIKKEQDEFIKLQEEAQKAFEEQKNELLKQINQNPETVEENQVNEDKEIVRTEQNEEQETIKEEIEKKEEVKMFMPFINVATIKGELFKEYLDKVQSFDKKLSLCRDSKNRIEIYFGPYDSQKERTKVLNNLMDNGFKESYLVDFTKEEYEKRCKY